MRKHQVKLIKDQLREIDFTGMEPLVYLQRAIYAAGMKPQPITAMWKDLQAIHEMAYEREQLLKARYDRMVGR